MGVSNSPIAVDTDAMGLLIMMGINQPIQSSLIMYNNIKVDIQFKHPGTYMNGSNRKFQPTWVEKYS